MVGFMPTTFAVQLPQSGQLLASRLRYGPLPSSALEIRSLKVAALNPTVTNSSREPVFRSVFSSLEHGREDAEPRRKREDQSVARVVMVATDH